METTMKEMTKAEWIYHILPLALSKEQVMYILLTPFTPKSVLRELDNDYDRRVDRDVNFIDCVMREINAIDSVTIMQREFSKALGITK